MSTGNRASWLLVGFLGVMLVMSLNPAMHMHAAAQNTLSLSLGRNIGIGLGGFIQGTFTIRGSGPAQVQNLTVYFNGEQVHFVTGSTINWQFDTANYPSGATNITLFGLDDAGVAYLADTQVFFIGGMMSTLLTVGIIALVAVLVIIRYGPMLRGKRKK
ncbi:MAG: hypothetical protein ACFE8Z_05965 [Candidatus Hermodarchaeota archaeon]